MSPYLDSIGTNFRHGANFATGGSSILPGGYSPFDLDIQIGQFMQFKSRSSALYKRLSHNSMFMLRVLYITVKWTNGIQDASSDC